MGSGFQLSFQCNVADYKAIWEYIFLQSRASPCIIVSLICSFPLTQTCVGYNRQSADRIQFPNSQQHELIFFVTRVSETDFLEFAVQWPEPGFGSARVCCHYRSENLLYCTLYGRKVLVTQDTFPTTRRREEGGFIRVVPLLLCIFKICFRTWKEIIHHILLVRSCLKHKRKIACFSMWLSRVYTFSNYQGNAIHVTKSCCESRTKRSLKGRYLLTVISPKCGMQRWYSL